MLGAGEEIVARLGVVRGAKRRDLRDEAHAVSGQLKKDMNMVAWSLGSLLGRCLFTYARVPQGSVRPWW